MKRKPTNFLLLLFFALVLLTTSASRSSDTKDVCEGCIRCLEHAPNPLCNCQKICALAVEKGCISPIKACPD